MSQKFALQGSEARESGAQQLCQSPASNGQVTAPLPSRSFKRNLSSKHCLRLWCMQEARRQAVRRASSRSKGSSNVLYAVMALLSELDDYSLRLVRAEVSSAVRMLHARRNVPEILRQSRNVHFCRCNSSWTRDSSWSDARQNRGTGSGGSGADENLVASTPCLHRCKEIHIHSCCAKVRLQHSVQLLQAIHDQLFRENALSRVQRTQLILHGSQKIGWTIATEL